MLPCVSKTAAPESPRSLKAVCLKDMMHTSSEYRSSPGVVQRLHCSGSQKSVRTWDPVLRRLESSVPQNFASIDFPAALPLGTANGALENDVGLRRIW